MERQPTYYELAGQAHEGILRCHYCKRLVPMSQVEKGACVCGSRKLGEVGSITDAEMVEIFRGRIDFPMRAEFLASFDYPGRTEGVPLESVIAQMEDELLHRGPDHV